MCGAKTIDLSPNPPLAQWATVVTPRWGVFCLISPVPKPRLFFSPGGATCLSRATQTKVFSSVGAACYFCQTRNRVVF